MLLTVEQLKNWKERSQVEDFLRLGIAEWHHIEYKSALGDWNKDQHREFFKDVTAFANANGGDILVGVKEPSEGVSPQDQIVGVEGSPDALTREWENRANGGGIDPKIPGLLVQTIPIDGSKCVMVIHVPPSASRPHMVSISDRRYFWKRHSKQVLPMNSYDIRESVLSAQSFEQRAMNQCIDAEREALDTRLKGKTFPVLIMQAAPIPPPVSRLPVYTDAVRAALLAEEEDFYPWRFISEGRPFPTIQGLLCTSTDPSGEERWYWEFYSTGFSHLVVPIMERNPFPGRGGWLIGDWVSWPLKAFASRMTRFLMVTKFDGNYLMRCSFHMLGEKCYWRSSGGTLIDAGEITLRCPDSIRMVGEPFQKTADEWYADLQCAYRIVPASRK